MATMSGKSSSGVKREEVIFFDEKKKKKYKMGRFLGKVSNWFLCKKQFSLKHCASNLIQNLFVTGWLCQVLRVS